MSLSEEPLLSSQGTSFWGHGQGLWGLLCGSTTPGGLLGALVLRGLQRVGFGGGSWQGGNPSAGVARRCGRQAWEVPLPAGQVWADLGLITGAAKVQDRASDLGEASAFRSVEPVLLGRPREPRAGTRSGGGGTEPVGILEATHPW